MKRHIVTANDLKDGLLVFLTNDCKWSHDIKQALIINSDDKITEANIIAQEAVKNNIIIDPYSVEITGENTEEMEVIEFREQIRTSGTPTIKYGYSLTPREK